MKTNPEALFHHYTTKTESCWIWKGNFRNSGYPRLFVGTYIQASQVAYFLDKEEKDYHKKMKLYNTCGNRSCVKPEHLTIMGKLSNNKEKFKNVCKDCGSYNVEYKKLSSCTSTQKPLASTPLKTP